MVNRPRANLAVCVTLGITGGDIQTRGIFADLSVTYIRSLKGHARRTSLLDPESVKSYLATR